MGNDLNVLTYDYLPLSYWKNWIHNIKQFFRNCKFAYQRITKGYCDRDMWSLDVFYAELFYHSLREFASTTHSYPGTEKIPTYEDWQLFLNEMAEHFYNSQEYHEDVPCNEKATRLYNEMSSYIEHTEFIKDDNEDFYRKVYIYSDLDKYNIAREKWLKGEKSARDFREREKNKAFKMLQESFFNLWD